MPTRVRITSSKPIVLGDRGSSAPVTIRGVDPSGRGARPLIVGGRTALYSPETASTGRPAIALDTGADHLSFVRLRFKNFGNGGCLLRGAVRDLTISEVTATNVRRFIESEEGSRVTALSVRQTKIVGFSKSAVRLRNDSHDVLFDDVVADSRHQDGGVFAMGFHLSGTVHDVVFRRVVAMNAWDTVTDYRNGDGFVAERGTYGLRFEDTQAIDNMDGGYDSKASDVTFVRANAWGNKRNFRLGESRRDGLDRGSGSGPTRRRRDAPHRYGRARRPVHDLGLFVHRSRRWHDRVRPRDGRVGVAVGTIVRHHPRKTIFRLAGTAEMTLNGKQLGG